MDILFFYEDKKNLGSENHQTGLVIDMIGYLFSYKTS